MRAGVAGCGRMGAPMLRALRAAGFDARGYDLRPPSDFGTLAPQMTDDAAAFGAGLTHLITVVRDAAQTDDVLFRAGLAKAPDLRVLIVCSTLSPRYVTALPDRLLPGLRLIDAPMSGAQIAAENRSLSFMLGGDPQVLDEVQPLLDAMGASFHRMGPLGAGMQAKVLNNLMAAASTAMTRQVMGWARDAGLDEARFLRLVAASSGQNWLASGWDSIEFAKDGYAPDNSIAILIKDVDAALDALPPGADTALPQAIQTVLRALTPY